MCGIIGIVGKRDVGSALYAGLTLLQHRGQDAAGIATITDSNLYLHKANGLVRDVFQSEHMAYLRGHIGIGHCRYPTAGSEGVEEAQPFCVNSPFSIALAHNGNLINADSLRCELFEKDHRHINTASDSEVLLNVFAQELHDSGEGQPLVDDVFRAIAAVHQRCLGGYAVVIAVLGLGIVAFRDAHGIRPLVFGKREAEDGLEWAVASESVALDALGFRLERDLRPGEALVITEDGRLFTRQCTESKQHAPCIFEYVYLARPDSVIENVSVYKARLCMGERLAKKIQHLRPHHDIEVVIPIPDTASTAALGLADTLGIKYREGFVKNRGVGRTFIMSEQTERIKFVRRKLEAIEAEFCNKVVLLVDDSIVRGTTSRQIIQLARNAGARKIYFASAAPPVRFPNVYGIDMPAPSELVAYARSEPEIQALIGCDWLIYQDLSDLIAAVTEGNERLRQFDTSCFSGDYVTGVPDGYFDVIAAQRAEQVRAEKRLTASAQTALGQII